jgi:hypothetical protein
MAAHAVSKEHRLRVSENKVLRHLFGNKRWEVTGGWRKVHSEKLHDCILQQILG